MMEMLARGAERRRWMRRGNRRLIQGTKFPAVGSRDCLNRLGVAALGVGPAAGLDHSECFERQKDIVQKGDARIRGEIQITGVWAKRTAHAAVRAAQPSSISMARGKRMLFSRCTC